MNFKNWLLNEQPLGASPGGGDIGGAPPPGGPAGAMPPGGLTGSPPPPMGGGLGGGLGGPGGGLGGLGPSMGGGPMAAGGPPIKPKSYDVWSVLEELLGKKQSDEKKPSKEQKNLVEPKSLKF